MLLRAKFREDGLLSACCCTFKGKKQVSKNRCMNTFCNIMAEQIDLDKNKIAEDGKNVLCPAINPSMG